MKIKAQMPLRLMTTEQQELRALDCWIARRVFDSAKIVVPHYTTDPAAAMLVLEKCVEKSMADAITPAPEIGIGKIGKGTMGSWYVRTEHGLAYGEAPTLPLAIARFAKQLFGGKE